MRTRRPAMPEGYGIATGDDGTMPWSWVVERCTRSRNFRARPDVVVHLESGDDMVVIEGRVETLDRSLLDHFVDAYEVKYGYRPNAEQTEGVYVVRPRRVLAWREKDFPTSATRYDAD